MTFDEGVDLTAAFCFFIEKNRLVRAGQSVRFVFG